MRILWRPLAATDLDAIISYVAEDNPQDAIELGETIERRVAELAALLSSTEWDE